MRQRKKLFERPSMMWRRESSGTPLTLSRPASIPKEIDAETKIILLSCQTLWFIKGLFLIAAPFSFTNQKDIRRETLTGPSSPREHWVSERELTDYSILKAGYGVEHE
jgi:hypothetical protein